MAWGWLRLLACVLAAIVPAAAFAGAARALPMPAAAADGVPVAWPPPWGSPAGQPVLLVAGPGADPEQVWGGKAGLRARLEAAGYRVWVADLSREEDPDPERLARLVIGPAAGRVLAACGAERLHVVAHGLGALAARYWVEAGGGDRVGTLVMLGPPNHGSFAMNMLHLAAALSARDAGLAEPGAAASSPQGAGLTAGSAAGAGSPLWSYVWDKAVSVYRSLYRRYVTEYRLGVPPSDVLEGARRLLGRLPFEGWLAHEEPQLFTREFRAAQEPLEGTSVTMAYAHAAALGVARAEELRALLRGPGLAQSLLEDPLITSDWKEMARHYGLKAARWAGRQLADWLTRQGQGLMLRQAPVLLGVDPFAPGMERVLEEYFSLPLGPEPDGRPRYERLLGNWFLKRWNEDTARRDLTRYVVVAGRVPNLWRLGWKQVGENDSWVQVDSCFLAPRPDDRFILVEDRGFSASHGGLPRNPRVQQIVLDELRFVASRVLYPRAGLPSRTISWSGEREMPLSPWCPGYLRIDSRYLNQRGDLEVELEPHVSTRAGMPPAWAWVESVGGSWERMKIEWSGDRARLTVSGFGQDVNAVLIGARLPLAPARGLIPSYREPVRGEIACRAVLRPSSGPAAQEPDRPGPEEPDLTRDQAGTVPVIRAVLRTKLTTHRKERRTYHVRWEWDFGDGSSFVDDDPAHTSVTVSHVFAGAGDYTVRARSYANDGRILRERVWHVRVSLEDVASSPVNRPDSGGSPVGPPDSAGSPVAGPDDAGPPVAGSDGARSTVGGAEAVEGVPAAPDGAVTVVVGQAWQATVETAREPKVRAAIDSPEEWMSGRPARIGVSVQVDEVPSVVERRVEVDPGREFVMVWERAGLFPVRVAVTVTLRYRFPEAEYTVRNTYLFERWVKVLTTSGTD